MTERIASILHEVTFLVTTRAYGDTKDSLVLAESFLKTALAHAYMQERIPATIA